MWNNTLYSDWVKDFVELGTEIIKIIDNIGVLRIAAAAFIIYMAKKWGGLDFSAMFSGLTEKGINKIFGKSVNQNIDATTSKLEELEQAVKQAKQAYVDDGGSKASQKALRNAEEQLETYKKLQKEGFNPSDKNKGYFGTEIQKIKDYKQELAGLETAIPEAERALQDAENELSYLWSQGEFGDVEIDNLGEYINKVNQAKIHVNDLKKKHADLKKTGSGAFQSLADGADALTKQIQSAVASMLVMYAISKVIQIIGDILDDAFETADEAKEIFEDLSSELATTKSELNTLESQLQEIQSQIEDINDNTPLTFTDQEELSRLEAQSAELQRQIDLLDTIKQEQSKGVNSSAINAAQKYSQTGVSTGKTTGENVGGKAGSGALIGAGVGVATGVGGAILTSAGVGTALGAWAGPVGMLIGAAIGAIAGGVLGAVVGGIESASEETVGESIENMREQYAKLQSEFEVARKNYYKDVTSETNKKKFEEAQEALNNYQSNMANYISEMDTWYSQIKQNWDTATTEQKEEYAEWADTMDTWAIQSNGVDAKANALNRMFGDEAEGGFAKAKTQIEEINSEIKKAQESGDEVAIANAFEKLDGFTLDVLSDEEIERLYNMGIYLHEAEDYFKDVVKAESEFVDVGLYDVVTDINSITDGLESMKSAFDEIIEQGSVTAKTMVSLNETFSAFNKTTDGAKAWLNYSNTVFSGAASIEQMTKATEEYVKAYLDYELATNNLTPENKWTYIVQLQNLDVENAQEYVEELLMQKMTEELDELYSVELLKEAYSEANKGIVGPIKPFEELDDTQLKELAEEFGFVAELSDEAKMEIAERYDVEEDAIDDVIAKLKQKQQAELDLSRAEQKQADYDTFIDKYKKAKQDLEYVQKSAEVKKVRSVGTYTIGTYKGEDGLLHYGGVYVYNGKVYENPDDVVEVVDEEALYIAQEAYNKVREQYSQYFDERGELKVDIPTKIALEIQDAQTALDEAVGDLESLSPELQLELDLVDRNQLVDDIQNIFDTLQDAVNEFNEDGYLSVDTAQKLIDPAVIDPKYLTLLQDENGQIRLNKQALYDVAVARLTDLGVKQQDAILTEAENLAKDGSIDKLRETTEVLYGEADALQAVNRARIESIRKILEERQAKGELVDFDIDAYIANLTNQVGAIGNIVESAKNNIENSLSASNNTVIAEGEDAFQKAMDYWENRIAANQAKYEQVQHEIDMLESQGRKAGAQYYQKQIDLENEQLDLLAQQKTAAEAYLGTLEEGSEEWWEVASTLNDIEGEIDDVTASIQDLNDAMADTHWYMFDEAHDRVSTLTSDLENIRDILSNEKLFDDEGNFTKEGLGTLASYVQELGIYEGAMADARKEMELFGDAYDSSKTYVDAYGNDLSIDSEQDWYEAAEKAEEKYDEWNQKAIETKYNIKDLYEQQIDAVEEYTDTLVDSYNDYIDSVKEALSAERD